MKEDFIPKINWGKYGGFVPAIIQDANNGLILMLGFMDREAISKTFKTKRVWFYSRSKKRLWMKGESSGNILKFVNASLDCDKDTVLIKAIPTGPTCHNGTLTCFGEEGISNIFDELYKVIADRRKKMPAGSYTSFLFKKGLNKICAKVKEESSEIIKAAKQESQKRLVEESVDVLYHLFVLLVQRNVTLEKLKAEIGQRRK